MYLGNRPKESLITSIESIKHRGPDNTTIISIDRDGAQTFIFGFHRLAINDLSENGNQPFVQDNIYLMCNGEIYNYKYLIKKYNLKVKSNSDCEVILHLYKLFGNIKDIIKELDGVYAFILYDKIKNKIFISRDRFGVRSLYYAKNGNEYAFSSELKAINFMNDVRQYPANTFSEIDETNKIFNFEYNILNFNKFKPNSKIIYSLMTKAVKKRIINVKDFGCLLSGGLDSSIICYLANKLTSHKIKTFSVGFENSPDLIAARDVAQFLKTDHYELIITPEDAINSIPEVINMIETYDTTTIRASVPMFLLCRYIKKTFPELKVILSGEGADELFGGYKYLSYRKDLNDLSTELKSLMSNIHFFDGLRADKCIAGNKLEGRFPFLDKNVVNYIFSINTKYKDSVHNIEKLMLRNAFKNHFNHSVIDRKKEAFSDGISKITNSWHTIIQNYTQTLKLEEKYYNINNPDTDENKWYREIYNSFYSNSQNIIPCMWKQKWTNNNDPSAREIKK